MKQRDKQGRFLPGARANPTGRPRGAAGLARHLRELTDDGRELVELALKIARDPEASHRDRIAAVQLLLDRGFGKPLQSIELHAAITAPELAPKIDLSRLSLDRQRELLELLREARALPPGDPGDE